MDLAFYPIFLFMDAFLYLREKLNLSIYCELIKSFGGTFCAFGQFKSIFLTGFEEN